MRQFIQSIILLLPVATLAACASHEPQVHVEIQRMDETSARIHAEGNAYASSGWVQDNAMFAAARTTRQMGCDLFMVVDSQNGARTDYRTAGQISLPAQSDGPFQFSRMGYMSGRMMAVEMPRSDLMIRMYHGPRPANAAPNLYVATEISQNLGPRILGTAYVPRNGLMPSPTTAPATSEAKPPSAPTLACYVGENRIPTDPADCQKLGGTMM